ncbi:MAG: ABC transporter substrate-binding protein, partial [Promethearchaeota archaeon]
MEKKNIIIIGLVIALAASGVGNVILVSTPYQGELPLNKRLVIGPDPSLYVLDPVNCLEYASLRVFDQVVETLFTYDLSDHALPRVPLLAESYWWESDTILHIKVREGIFFHDLTPFNANATKWNLDRLLYLTNCTGILPDTMVPGDPSLLYFFSDGVTPIINNVVSDGTYNVTITLNAPFAPFLDLLCYIASAMLSPTSTPDDDFISRTYGRLIGTGPFIYEYYVPNIEVKLRGFESYWQGAPFLEEIILYAYPYWIRCYTTRNCGGTPPKYEIDWLTSLIPSLISTFDEDPAIHVEHFTDNYNLPGLIYYYLGMNNKKINVTWRKAISYAINYSFIIEELMNNLGVRANSPISPSFGDSHNASVNAANFDLNMARQTLVGAGIAAGYPINSDPNDIYWLSNPLISLNYTYNIGNSFREDIYDALLTWLPAIGIQVIDDGVTWSAYLKKLFETQDELHLFWVGWGPDYKDPFTMLDQLFNPTSYANSAQVNDTKLNAMLVLALQTTDDTARNIIYKNIQWYLSNRLFPQCFGYHPKIFYIHKVDLHGIPYNALTRFYAYPV